MKNLTILSAAFVLITLFSASGQAQGRRGSRAGKTESAATTEQTSQKRTGTNISSQQQQNLKALESDLKAIKTGSQVTQAQKDALKSSLSALAEGAVRPDPALVQTLTDDLSKALSDGVISDTEKVKLASDLQKILNSANIPVNEVTTAIAAAQVILQASNIDRGDVEKIMNDLNAIVNEVRSNLPKSGTKTNSTSRPPRGRRPRN